MRIVAISDTHGQHNKLQLPGGDLLVHAGDVSMRGGEAEIRDFLSWMDKQDFRYKLFIAGNHDFFFEQHTAGEIKDVLPAGIMYLNTAAAVIEGIKFWGSPVTPWFHDWAFNRQRGADIARHWDLIPADTDVLLTHGPMYRRLDAIVNGQHKGCEELLLKSRSLQLKAHIFGHIHERYGTMERDGIRFLNASVLDERYEMVNEPLVLEL